jgi:hypothetical protein
MQEHLKQELRLWKKPPTCRKSRTIETGVKIVEKTTHLPQVTDN